VETHPKSRMLEDRSGLQSLSEKLSCLRSKIIVRAAMGQERPVQE
jgi:hypothetical protein